ncbi:phosphoribosyltransferase [Candidatus Woesearchaeota archaeon]|nr:MAG: phosphoribosyltransferase [Candidatus Woesearchaeota archaeon]
MESFNCILLSWQDVVNEAKKISDLIKKDDFHPDVVVGISRGGLVPARLICDFLHVKSCFTLKVDHWGLTATKDGEAKLTHPLNKDLTGLNVLLVDDITDSGQSIELARQHLEELNPKSLKVATLYTLKGAKHHPDYYGEEREWAWMVFPWNYTEDMVNIIKKINEKENKEINIVQSELKQNYNLDVSQEEIKEIIEHINYLDKVNN